MKREAYVIKQVSQKTGPYTILNKNIIIAKYILKVYKIGREYIQYCSGIYVYRVLHKFIIC